MTPERHARGKELFLAACRLSPEQRPDWLDERCGDDAGLRAEVERETDGRWLAEVPDLPGVMAYGETREAALANCTRLAADVLADRDAHGECVA